MKPRITLGKLQMPFAHAGVYKYSLPAAPIQLGARQAAKHRAAVGPVPQASRKSSGAISRAYFGTRVIYWLFIPFPALLGEGAKLPG